MNESQVLLIGSSATALAERIEASGYRVLDWSSGAASAAAVGGEPTSLALLSADESNLIPHLRRHFRTMSLLLDIESDSLENRVRCLGAGADDFWLSSHPPSELLLRFRCYLQSQARRERRTPPILLADLSLDPESQQVKRGARALELAAREYALLELLLMRQGQVLSRKLILNQVWDEQSAGSNVVEVYVRYLRQKMEQQGEPRLLHNVGGRGYCLSEAPPASL